MHGHSYRVRVWITAPLHPDLGWAIDFADVDEIVAPVIDLLDHSTIDDCVPISTAENLAVYIWDHVHKRLPGRVAIEVSETGDTGVLYDPWA